MNDDRKKLLTEYLGECWHERGNDKWCIHCHIHTDATYRNRTFTTPDDMMALKDKLDKKGDWFSFYLHARFLWSGSNEPFNRATESNFSCHLINPIRFCELVGEWIKERRE